MSVDPKQLRIVYMGTPDFAVAPLRTLVEGGYRVVAVVTMPDKPAGRGLKMQESAVKRYAASVGLPVLQPERLKDEAFLDALRALDPDLGIVVAFRMLPRVVFDLPRYGTFNLHASLLPQYRGAAPINWAIINGERETGVTTFILNPKMDEGAIIDSRTVPILPEDNAGTLHDKLMEVGAALVAESVAKVADADFHPQAQPELAPEELKPAPKIFKETCRIDFGAEGERIIRLIRGMAPYPGAWTTLEERAESDGAVLRSTDIKIYAARFETATVATDRIGEVTVAGGALRIACRDGYLLPELIQPAGKPRMAVRDFLNGWKPKGECRFV